MTALLVGDVLRAGAARRPSAIAATLDGTSFSYAELEVQTQSLEAALRSAGVMRGDRVVWQSEVSLDAIPLYFATARIGAMFVPINIGYTSDETARVIAHADPKLTLGDASTGHDRLERLLARPATGDGSGAAPQEDDPHVIFYTSGTTGEPKGCMLSQRTQRLRAGNRSPYPLGGELCMFPQFHMAGWARALEHWVEGNEVTFVRRPDAEVLMDAASRRRSRSLYCIPAVWQRILNSDRSGYDLSSLRQVDTGTSAVSASLLVDLAKAFPLATTSISYGSTEGGLVCVAGPDEGDYRASSVGFPPPGVMLRIDDGGELLVDSPYLFSGYFRNEVETERALSGGCYHTGDLADRDSEGRYRIIGRKNDLIRTGGETVAPVEVEMVLRDCPGIAEVAIVGVPNPAWGQVITAFIVAQPGQEITLDILRAHCGTKLARHKHPRRMELVETLPKTAATGQIQRRHLNG